MGSKKRGGASGRLFRVALSSAIIAVLLLQIDLPGLADTIRQASLSMLALAFAMLLAEQAAGALVWKAMIAEKGFKAPFSDILRVVLASDFLGAALPTSMGSDVVKVAGLSRYIGSVPEAFSSLVAFRVIGLGIMFTAAAAAGFFFSGALPDEPVIEAVTWALFAATGLAAAGIVFSKTALSLAKMLLGERVYLKLERVHGAFMFYMSHPRALSAAAAGGLFIQLNRIVYMYVVSLALGLDAPLVSFFVFVPVVTALTMIPVSISGIGVREGGYVFLFGYAGLSAGQAFSLSILGFAVNMLYVLFAGVMYWVFGAPSGERLDKIEEQIQRDAG